MSEPNYNNLNSVIHLKKAIAVDRDIKGVTNMYHPSFKMGFLAVFNHVLLCFILRYFSPTNRK